MIDKFWTAPGSLREQTSEILAAIEPQNVVTLARKEIDKKI